MFFFVFTVDCSFTKWLLHCVLCLFASIQFLCFFVVELSVYIYAVNHLLCTVPVYDAVYFIPTELQGLVTPKNKILVFTIVQNQLYQALFWGSFTAMWHTNNARNVFFLSEVVVGRKCCTRDIHQWQWKMDRMPTVLAEKQVTVSPEPLAQLPWSYSVRVDCFAHLVLSMAASSAWRTCLTFRVAWRWVHTRPQTHVVIIWLDLHLG